MNTNYFHPEYINELGKNPLSQDEKLKGNKLFLKFMDLDDTKSDKWIIDCALYDQSWDELMKIALKITSFWTENSSDMNGLRFKYKHMMFHQIMDFNFLYRQSMAFVEAYNEWLPTQE